MDTYTGDYDQWQLALESNLALIGRADRLGVGLDTESFTYSDEQLQRMFDKLRTVGVHEVDVWRLPTTQENFWKALTGWLENEFYYS